mmetsp:Transcript_13377/g.20854  ORF Transcript_13377/g.20854 Transcript_13377/m.20854 type:complete len:541 (+) Transcript_13377:125-1747(+)
MKTLSAETQENIVVHSPEICQQNNLSPLRYSAMSLSSEDYLAFEGRTLHDLTDCVRQNRAVPLRLAKRAASGIDRKVAKLRESFRHLDDESAVKRDLCLPKFYIDEIKLGTLLGQGSFSQVFEIESFNLRKSPHERSDYPTIKEEKTHRLALADRSSSSSQEKFVVKFLRPECLFDPVKFSHAASGLVCETQLLSSFNHPNIVNIRGLCVANTATEAYETAKHDGYFFIMEQLQETLSDQIRLWKKRNKRPSWLKKVELQRERQFFLDRLAIARNIASALDYIHQHRVVFRDLKPDNIGFDSKGDVKIFDFGLAIGLPNSTDDTSDAVAEEKTFDLTGKVGTFRYMAPEVHRCEAYNSKADVYSFSLVLYELLALEQPYINYTKQMHSTLVVHEGERPLISETWPFIIQCILEEGWSDDVLERPTMREMLSSVHQVVCVLETSIAGNRTGSLSLPNGFPSTPRSPLRSSFKGSLRTSLRGSFKGSRQGSFRASLTGLNRADSQHSPETPLASGNRRNSFRQRDSLKSLETAQTLPFDASS